MRRGFVVIAVTAALLASGAAWLHHDRTTDGPLTTGIDRYGTFVSADGRQLTVHYTGGACGHEHAKAHVRETSAVVEVTVVVRITDTPSACSAMGIGRPVVIHLKAPLGNRRVVDTHCRHPEWGAPEDCPAPKLTVARASEVPASCMRINQQYVEITRVSGYSEFGSPSIDGDDVVVPAAADAERMDRVVAVAVSSKTQQAVARSDARCRAPRLTVGSPGPSRSIRRPSTNPATGSSTIRTRSEPSRSTTTSTRSCRVAATSGTGPRSRVTPTSCGNADRTT